MPVGEYDRNVFINCPFDDDYAPLFEAIVSSDDVTEGKPHPESYLRALELVGVRGDVLAGLDHVLERAQARAEA